MKKILIAVLWLFCMNLDAIIVGAALLKNPCTGKAVYLFSDFHVPEKTIAEEQSDSIARTIAQHPDAKIFIDSYDGTCLSQSIPDEKTFYDHLFETYHRTIDQLENSELKQLIDHIISGTPAKQTLKKIAMKLDQDQLIADVRFSLSSRFDDTVAKALVASLDHFDLQIITEILNGAAAEYMVFCGAAHYSKLLPALEQYGFIRTSCMGYDGSFSQILSIADEIVPTLAGTLQRVAAEIFKSPDALFDFKKKYQKQMIRNLLIEVDYLSANQLDNFFLQQKSF